MTKRKRRPPDSARARPHIEDEAPSLPDEPDEIGAELETPSSGPPALDRLAAIAGLLFSVLTLAGLVSVAGSQVRPDASAREIAERLVENRGWASLGVLVLLVGLFFLLLFVTYVHRVLRMADRDGSWLPTLALGGGLLLVAAISMMVLVAMATIPVDDYGDEPGVAKTLVLLQAQSFFLAVVPAASLLGAMSLVGRRTGLLPPWLTSLGLVLAAGNLIVPVALLPFTVALMWIGAASLILFRRGSPRRRAPQAT